MKGSVEQSLDTVKVCVTGRKALRNPPKHVYIYFVRGGELIKIGQTRDLDVRLRGLQMMSPVGLHLLGAFTAKPSTERELHKQFIGDRAYGEWFRASSTLEKLAAELSLPEFVDKPLTASTRKLRVGSMPAAYGHVMRVTESVFKRIKQAQKRIGPLATVSDALEAALNALEKDEKGKKR